jgi:hypothetical protein
VLKAMERATCWEGSRVGGGGLMMSGATAGKGRAGDWAGLGCSKTRTLGKLAELAAEGSGRGGLGSGKLRGRGSRGDACRVPALCKRLAVPRTDGSRSTTGEAGTAMRVGRGAHKEGGVGEVHQGGGQGPGGGGAPQRAQHGQAKHGAGGGASGAQPHKAPAGRGRTRLRLTQAAPAVQGLLKRAGRAGDGSHAVRGLR